MEEEEVAAIVGADLTAETFEAVCKNVKEHLNFPTPEPKPVQSSRASTLTATNVPTQAQSSSAIPVDGVCYDIYEC